MNNDNILLTCSGLRTYFYTDDGVVKAVDDVNFTIERGKTLGIVGESGCGKSVTSHSIMQLVPKPHGKISGGEIIYRGHDGEEVNIADLDPFGPKMRQIRGNEIAMIFQEPMTSLNPVYSIGDQIIESIRLHQKLNKKDAKARAIEMLKLVGIPAAELRVNEYPHQLSGGMRQRVMIAMALSCNPKLLIADEPTTALDVTIEAQILELMVDLQKKLGMSIMIITHDLGVVGELADDVAVMYAGKVVENAAVVDLFDRPLHPYTQGLLNSRPVIGNKKRLFSIPGNVPHLAHLPKGCPFAARCANAKDICLSEEPAVVDAGQGHSVRCWLHA
ncbi:MAG: ABC transporter ATP-binding protein [Spirochaetales bacterium]|nr:ABC transporter ATP-binding protein [Spirochaetales bacterium]